MSILNKKNEDMTDYKEIKTFDELIEKEHEIGRAHV